MKTTLLINMIFLLSENVYAAHTNYYPIFIASINCYDADTCMNARISLPFNLTKIATIRLLGVDAPEIRSPEKKEAMKSRNWLRKTIAKCNELKASLHGTGSFGRELVTLYCDKININHLIIKLGFAEEYER